MEKPSALQPERPGNVLVGKSTNISHVDDRGIAHVRPRNPVHVPKVKGPVVIKTSEQPGFREDDSDKKRARQHAEWLKRERAKKARMEAAGKEYTIPGGYPMVDRETINKASMRPDYVPPGPPPIFTGMAINKESEREGYVAPPPAKVKGPTVNKESARM